MPQLKLVNAYPNLKFKRPLWFEQLADGRTFLLEQKGIVLILPHNSNGKKTKVFKEEKNNDDTNRNGKMKPGD